MRLFVVVGLALSLSPPPQAQAQMVDEGSFILRVNGERVGRETFQIKRNPAAGTATIAAGGAVTMGTRRLQPMLTTDTAGQVISYELEIKVNGAVATHLTGDANNGRYTQNSPTARGQSHKEMRLDRGTVVLDDDIVHQLYFVAQWRGQGRVPVFVPQRVERDSIAITNRGAGNVELTNGTVPATHLILTNAAGTVTDLWVDAAGRVLRVAIPSRHFEAVREEAPR